MATKGKILIVDDDLDFVKTTKMMLLADGYEVVVAQDGKQGLEKIKEARPDLVLLDVMMESIFEGYSFLGALRTGPEFSEVKSTPIVMISSVRSETGSRFSFSDEEDMGDIPEPDEFLDKPLKPKELLQKIAAIIGKKAR
jgi:CheY-like chemotaxis protein